MRFYEYNSIRKVELISVKGDRVKRPCLFVVRELHTCMFLAPSRYSYLRTYVSGTWYLVPGTTVVTSPYELRDFYAYGEFSPRYTAKMSVKQGRTYALKGVGPSVPD